MLLAALGFDVGEDRTLLIDPPDEVLAEAGRMDPRPKVSSSLQVAAPAGRIAWWPRGDDLEVATLSRLAWMLSAADAGVEQ